MKNCNKYYHNFVSGGDDDDDDDDDDDNNNCGRTFVSTPNQVLFALGWVRIDHTHYSTPFLRLKAYKARLGGVSPRCEIKQIRAGGT